MLRRTPLLFAAFVLLILGPWSGRARGEDQAKDVVVIHSLVDLVHEEEIADLDQVVQAIVSEAGVATPLKGQPGMFVVKAPAQVQNDLALTIDILRRTLHDAHSGGDRDQLMKRAVGDALANGRTLAALRSTRIDFAMEDGPCTAVLEQIVGRGPSRAFSTFVTPKATQLLQQKRVSNLAIEHATVRRALNLLMVLTGLEWSLTGRGVLTVHAPEDLEVEKAAQARKAAAVPDVLEAIRALRVEVAALAETLRRGG